jgi:copper transport protein
MTRVLAAAAAAVVMTAAAAAAILLAPTALAATAEPVHAALGSTQPADGSVVAREPSQVTASFNQPVSITASSLEVYTPQGSRADDGQTVHVGPTEIAVTLLPNLGNGTYTATWHVISADTHPVEGAFTFSIGAPSATHVAALGQSSNTLVSALFTVARGIEYTCYALLCGAVAFLIVCWPAGGRRQGIRRLVLGSWVGLLLSTLLGLLLQGPYAAGEGIGNLFDPTLVNSTVNSKLGTASEAREIMAFLAGAVAGFLLPRLPAAGRRLRVTAAVVWGILTTAVAASWAVYDHASTGIQVPVALPSDIIHLDSMAVWIGGLVVLAGFTLRGLADATVAVAVPRFSAIALGCVATIVATGAYQTWRQVGVWNALFDTASGRLILAKIAGLLVLIALGYLARRYIQRGLAPAPAAVATPALAPASAGGVGLLDDADTIRDGGAGAPGEPRPGVAGPAVAGSGGPGLGGPGLGGPGPGWAPAMRRLRKSVVAELAVAAVILAFTSLLVNTATGREAYAPTVSASQQFNTGAPGGAGTVHLFITPARIGPNTIEVYFTKPGGGTYVPAQVQANLYFSAKNIGPEPVSLKTTTPGQYRNQTVTVTFTGQWTLQLIIRSDAFDETSVTFPVAVH